MQLTIAKNKDPVVNTLGISWNSEDTLALSAPTVSPDLPITKRNTLKKVAVVPVFDPLGLVSPFVIVAKAILQELWLVDTTGMS